MASNSFKTWERCSGPGMARDSRCEICAICGGSLNALTFGSQWLPNLCAVTFRHHRWQNPQSQRFARHCLANLPRRKFRHHWWQKHRTFSSRHRARFASANGAPQPQPSAIGLGIVTHKIPSSERANQTFARLHASQNASKLPSGDAPQSSATRRGIVVDYPTKTKSLVPSGPASSGENAQFPIDQSQSLIRFRAGFLTAPRTSGTKQLRLMPPRHRARFASANGAPQPQPSAIGLGIVTHNVAFGSPQAIPEGCQPLDGG